MTSSSEIADDPIYLDLSPTPIRFEPVSEKTNVFYDDANQQVFAVRSGGATGVVCKGPKDSLNCTFRMADKGPVLSIKFSPDLKVLAVQRSPHSVEFMNFVQSSETLQEYSQSSRNKNSQILGFIWIASNEILLINKSGLELFQIYSEKRNLKFLKNISIPVTWFVHSPESNILVVSSTGGCVQPYHLRPGNIYKYHKLEISNAGVPKNTEKDVSIAVLYNQPAVLILRHKSKSSTCSGAEIDVHPLNRDKPVTKSHVLKLDTSGRFAINVIDNLIIVHHQASKTSMLFDIRLSGGCDGFATYHQAVVVPMPIRPFKLKLPMAPSASMTEPSEVECEMYSGNWVVFQPNIMIDAKLGCLWTLQLKLTPVMGLMLDKIRLVEFLLQRSAGKKYMMQFLHSLILDTESPDLSLIAEIFDKLNNNYKSFLHMELQSQMALPVSGKSEIVKPKGCILVDQQDLYTHIFSNFHTKKTTGGGDQYMVFILTEYIRSLNEFKIPVQHYIYELVINAMVRLKAFFQLHQLLQYHVVADSKPLACLLLSLEGVYPASLQLAMDMLRRLKTADDLIIDILLNKYKVISALRFARSCGKGDQISARKFLEYAKKSEDHLVYYAVYKFFEDRNQRLKGHNHFDPSDMCEDYVEHFQSLFN